MPHWRAPNRSRMRVVMEADIGPIMTSQSRVALPRERRWIASRLPTVSGVVAGLVLLALAIAYVVGMPRLLSPAKAHGSAEWIQRGGYKNSIGELCCGVKDCSAIDAADVQSRPDGYYIVSLKETVPYHEATPTPPEIGGYWRCYWGGKRKCFFAPPGAV